LNNFVGHIKVSSLFILTFVLNLLVLEPQNNNSCKFDCHNETVLTSKSADKHLSKTNYMIN